MKKTVESISVVIPAYQESAAIGDVVSAVLRVVATVGCEYEVIVVDDGSTDGTGNVARKAGAHVLTHPYNKA